MVDNDVLGIVESFLNLQGRTVVEFGFAIVH